MSVVMDRPMIDRVRKWVAWHIRVANYSKKGASNNDPHCPPPLHVHIPFWPSSCCCRALIFVITLCHDFYASARFPLSQHDGTVSSPQWHAFKDQRKRRNDSSAEKVERPRRRRARRRRCACICDAQERNAAAEQPGLRGWRGMHSLRSLCCMQTLTRRQKSDKPGRRSKRRTVRRGLSKFKRVCIRHTWLLPLIVGLTIVSLYLVYPYPSNPLSACLFLSYPLPRDDPLIAASVRSDPSAPTQYGKGARDFAFVAFYIIVLSFTREFCMQRLIRPLAIACGIKSRAKQSRFMEQAYTALYFAIYGPFGLWVMSRTPVWYFNTTGMYEGFPHRTHEAVFKAYYLLQASYWAQQAIVLMLMLEKPRKDFKELVAHHIITVSLIWLSYRFHFTYIGIAVYITHDVSDFFLAVSLPPSSNRSNIY